MAAITRSTRATDHCRRYCPADRRVSQRLRRLVALGARPRFGVWVVRMWLIGRGLPMPPVRCLARRPDLVQRVQQLRVGWLTAGQRCGVRRRYTCQGKAMCLPGVDEPNGYERGVKGVHRLGPSPDGRPPRGDRIAAPFLD
jgi:hypothetical protein